MQFTSLPFLLPSDEEKAIVSKDVQVDVDKLNNGMKLFREWLKCENYLPSDVDEILIRNFLYGCKGNLEIAKSKFEKYMVNRTKLTLLYNSRQGDRKVLDSWDIHRICCVSPKLTPEGYRVMCFSLPTTDSTNFDCLEVYKRILLQFDLHLFADENAGYEFVYDTKNFTMALMSKLNLSLTHHMMQIMYNILPFRLKKIHVINTTPAMDIILDMTMKVISKKLKDRIHHVKTEELTHHLPAECLPNEYGGTAGQYNVLCDQYNDFLIDNLKWVKETEDLKLSGPIPENKKVLYSFEESSMDGSFRKLNID